MGKIKAAGVVVVGKVVAVVADRAAADADPPLTIAAPQLKRADFVFVPSAGNAKPMNAVFPASCKSVPNVAAP